MIAPIILLALATFLALLASYFIACTNLCDNEFEIFLGIVFAMVLLAGSFYFAFGSAHRHEKLIIKMYIQGNDLRGAAIYTQKSYTCNISDMEGIVAQENKNKQFENKYINKK